jgi:hypothetical protein
MNEQIFPTEEEYIARISDEGGTTRIFSGAETIAEKGGVKNE